MRPRLDLGCVGGDTSGEFGGVSKIAAHMPKILLQLDLNAFSSSDF
jgi:hypothetical protein